MAYKFGASVPTGVRPKGITFGDGTLWVANETSGTVKRVDTATLAVTATITVADPRTVQYAFGYCFVGDSSNLGTIYKIDPATNTVVGSILVYGNIMDLSFDATYLYFTLGTASFRPPGFLAALNPTTLTIPGYVGAADVATAGTVGAGSLWLADVTGIIRRYNATTYVLQATITLPAGYATALTYAFGSIWAGVLSSPFSSVERIDPATNAIIPTAMHFSQNISSYYFATQTSSLWVSNVAFKVQRIDPTSNTFADTLTIPYTQSPDGMGVDGTGAVWVSYSSAINRIDNLAVGWVRGHAWG